MTGKARVLTQQQAQDVWSILVRCCGARDGVREAFARLLSTSTTPVRWTFDGGSESGTFCFPEMHVINRTAVPTGSWVAMIQRANEEISRVLPAGFAVDRQGLPDLAPNLFIYAAASVDARKAGGPAHVALDV